MGFPCFHVNPFDWTNLAISPLDGRMWRHRTPASKRNKTTYSQEPPGGVTPRSTKCHTQEPRKLPPPKPIPLRATLGKQCPPHSSPYLKSSPEASGHEPPFLRSTSASAA